MTKQRSIKGLLIYLLVGVIALVPLYIMSLSAVSTDPAKLEKMREAIGISGSPEMLALLSGIPTFILIIIALVIGFFTAHKVGLKSVVIHPNAREKTKSEWIKGVKLAIILGSIAAVVLRGFDYLLLPFLPDGIKELIHPYNAIEFLAALLYGGVVEELLLRFGFMSLLVLVLWKLFDRKSEKPANWVFILAIFVSTLLFALGHYSATANVTEMTGFIWFRMILLNGFAGVFFGWIYWKQNLELAMLAHMFAHITMNFLMLIVSFFV